MSDDEHPVAQQADGADGSAPAATASPGSARSATITTTHADAATAQRVAASVRPDNTPSIETRVEGDRVTTRITRETTGGLQATVDDYVVNVTVATDCTTDSDGGPGSAAPSPHDRRDSQ